MAKTKHLLKGNRHANPTEVPLISTKMHKQACLSVIITPTRYYRRAVDQKGKPGRIISIFSSFILRAERGSADRLKSEPFKGMKTYRTEEWHRGDREKDNRHRRERDVLLNMSSLPASVMRQEEAAAQEDADTQLMYKIERPVYDEAFIQSQLLHRKENSTTLRQRLAQRFRWV